MSIIPFWIRLLPTLNKAWIPSSPIPLRHQNWTLPWMSLKSSYFQSLLGFSTWLVLFLIILNCSLLLALDFTNCGARLGLFLLLCLWIPRCWHLNWFVIYLATLQPLDSGPLLHQITSPWLLPTGKLVSCYQIFRWCCCCSSTLDTEQLISHLTVALVDTLSSLPNSEGGFIPMSGVWKLLLKAHDILDNAVSKWVGNSALILAHLFNSVSRQCCEVWASQFPFLHSLIDVIPPSEACLYGHINWSLVQAQQWSSMGLSHSFPSKRGGNTRPKAGFHFPIQKRPVTGSVPGSGGVSLANRPHLESGNEAHPSGKKSAGGSVSTSSSHTRRKWGHGGQHSWCVTVLSLLIIFICSFSGWYVFQIFRSMEKHHI